MKMAQEEEKKSDDEDEGNNPLALRLVELWSQGKLSAKQVAEISHLSMLSGNDHPDVLALAKCGGFGQNMNLCHRDMVALYCKKMEIAKPHLVKAPIRDPKTQKHGEEDLALLLPHMIFSNMSHHYPDVFEDMFAIQKCGSFWRSVEKTKDPRLLKPVTLTKGEVASAEKTVPVFIHGDGCEFQTRDSLMTWSWGSMLPQNPSLSSHILLTAVPKSCSIAGTWSPLNDWICWSFSALAKGRHPEVDPAGKPLTKGLLAELAGQPLTKGLHRAVIWAIQGDAEFMANVLGLPHWQNKFPCHECNCQRPIFQKVPCPAGRSVKILKSEEQDFEYKTVEQSVLDKRTEHPLFKMQGVTPLHVRGDSLHILFSRGVASHLAGSLLHYICYFDWPRRQKVPAASRLETLFARIKEIYTESAVPARLSNLRLTMICDPTKPFKGYPCLEAKASETKWFLPCLEMVLKEVLDLEEDPIHHTMMEAIKAFNGAVQHFDAVGAFLTDHEYAVGQAMVKTFFDSYADLNSWALTKGRKLFHITHKFHSALHLFRNTRFLNYRAHHNYKAEDFVGQISALGHSCSFGVKAPRIPMKLMDKYRILLHLQLTKPGFASATESPDL